MVERPANVIVIGAGPTGLLLAIELVLAGARVEIFERLAAPTETIKAGMIGALAGEALERRGLGPALEAEEGAMREDVAAFRRKMGLDPATAVTNRGGHFAGLNFDLPRQGGPERRPRGVRRQLELELMLDARARALGVEIRRGYELVDFAEEADLVRVDLAGPEGGVSLTCAYLVGCDGGRSTVRKQGGFAFPGTDPSLTGHQAIVELDPPETLATTGWRRTPTGMMSYGTLPGRLMLLEFDGPPEDRDAPVTRDGLEAILRRVSGVDVRIKSLKSAGRWTDNARQASNYRRGRVFLAGDAAHVHSPFGGQGLNLGLLDAANLGWKLAAVLRGDADDDLLDSYSAERHPVAARVLSNTRAQVAIMRPDEQAGAMRDIVADLIASEEGARYFGEMISGLKTRYDLGSDDPDVGRLSADIALGGEGAAATSLYALMQSGGGVLIDAAGGAASEVAVAWGSRVHCVEARDRTSRLVRPDACIAWTSAGDAVDGLEAALHRWFGPPRRV